MINNPKDIKELIDTFKEVPEQIIKKSIKEIIKEGENYEENNPDNKIEKT